ncbi:hypothetical protein CALCODRAFT_544066 [Calocera cornea HHB12733]|uniref:Uncharacterized protein n=1 Tax=Calocera cornea HHB12733 TaxID=1353952 RepID=A0A165F8A3_9BASI|nr:hypothetical protein CALCODRAFT_544066 [Calocera cornea HHB12733]
MSDQLTGGTDPQPTLINGVTDLLALQSPEPYRTTQIKIPVSSVLRKPPPRLFPRVPKVMQPLSNAVRQGDLPLSLRAQELRGFQLLYGFGFYTGLAALIAVVFTCETWEDLFWRLLVTCRLFVWISWDDHAADIPTMLHCVTFSTHTAEDIQWDAPVLNPSGQEVLLPNRGYHSHTAGSSPTSSRRTRSTQSTVTQALLHPLWHFLKRVIPRPLNPQGHIMIVEGVGPSLPPPDRHGDLPEWLVEIRNWMAWKVSLDAAWWPDVTTPFPNVWGTALASQTNYLANNCAELSGLFSVPPEFLNQPGTFHLVTCNIKDASRVCQHTGAEKRPTGDPSLATKKRDGLMRNGTWATLPLVPYDELHVLMDADLDWQQEKLARAEAQNIKKGQGKGKGKGKRQGQSRISGSPSLSWPPSMRTAPAQSRYHRSSSRIWSRSTMQQHVILPQYKAQDPTTLQLRQDFSGPNGNVSPPPGIFPLVIEAVLKLFLLTKSLRISLRRKKRCFPSVLGHTLRDIEHHQTVTPWDATCEAANYVVAVQDSIVLQPVILCELLTLEVVQLHGVRHMLSSPVW